MEAASPEREAGGAWWVTPLVIVILGVGAYCNSFTGPFVYDDILSIVMNPRIRSLAPDLRPTMELTSLTGRPVTGYTFQLTYWAVGLNTPLYHVTNLLVHLGCALLLYGIVRRNLSNRAFWGERFAGSERWIAGTVAAVWAVHPLDTAAVTYIIQRTESLTAMFYLGVIYCLIRSVEEGRRGWALAAVGCCALGMGGKETMVTAPAVVLLYDRTFFTGSFKETLKRRWIFYTGLAGTWVILGILLALNREAQLHTLVRELAVKDYARTQLDVIAHYLRLAFWPAGQVFESNDWPITRGWAGIGAGGWMVVLLAVGTVVAFWAKPWLGFLGAWFFVILSPSSSVVPMVSELIVEQRMYMPLMAVVVLVVGVGWWIAKAWGAQKPAVGLAVAAIVALAWTTAERNAVYGDEETLWRDVVAKRPGNAKAHWWLGSIYSRTNRLPEAVEEFRTSLRLRPDFRDAVHGLGQALISEGDVQGAERFCDEQIRDNTPAAEDAHFLRGSIRLSQENWEGAKEDFQAVVAVDPEVAGAHYWLGIALEQLHEWKEAASEFDRTAQIDPNYRDVSEHLVRLRMMPEVRN